MIEEQCVYCKHSDVIIGDDGEFDDDFLWCKKINICVRDIDRCDHFCENKQVAKEAKW